jgi:hypothetical protein
MDWIDLAYYTDRWQASVNSHEPLGFIKYVGFLH